MFIAEASDRDQQPDTPPAPPGQRLHLSSRDAAEVAAEAGVRRLLLTHFWPGNDVKLPALPLPSTSTVTS